MYDMERIGKIISDIEKYFRDLEELKIEKIEASMHPKYAFTCAK